jgi:hypothetical protein
MTDTARIKELDLPRRKGPLNAKHFNEWENAQTQVRPPPPQSTDGGFCNGHGSRSRGQKIWREALISSGPQPCASFSRMCAMPPGCPGVPKARSWGWTGKLSPIFFFFNQRTKSFLAVSCYWLELVLTLSYNQAGRAHTCPKQIGLLFSLVS